MPPTTTLAHSVGFPSPCATLYYSQSILAIDRIVTDFHHGLLGEQAEQNTALIASIQKQRGGVENLIKLWDENIERLHFIYSNLTSEANAPEVDRTIDIVQAASDDLKKGNRGYSSILHILETTNELIKTNLAERDEKIRQINIDFERAIDKLNVTNKVAAK